MTVEYKIGSKTCGSVNCDSDSGTCVRDFKDFFPNPLNPHSTYFEGAFFVGNTIQLPVVV